MPSLLFWRRSDEKLGGLESQVKPYVTHSSRTCCVCVFNGNLLGTPSLTIPDKYIISAINPPFMKVILILEAIVWAAVELCCIIMHYYHWDKYSQTK